MVNGRNYDRLQGYLADAKEKGAELIEVNPAEVKLATVGKRTAAKEDMIEWAIDMHPEVEWFTYKRGGKMLYSDKNEHIADAVCAIYAGIQTQQFKNLTAALSAIKATA